ncbi:MAG TPA: sugar phosphate isomerase/epimerase family protein [Cyclobacteriaceae bacterium]|nr:sugar phosphate isomerase/epimerase family protein [Cyclobacteriaceae bacterium]
MKRNRRDFIKISGLTGLGMAVMNPMLFSCSATAKPGMEFGLVTYNWGRDWDLPTLIRNCEEAGYKAVELRTQNAHGVETSLSASEREEVKKRFADSDVTCVGYGSNYEYHSPDPEELRRNIEQSKEYVKLCYDIGGTGLKVKPNTLPPDVSREKTIAQIATALNEVGAFARDYNQLIRVEAHGKFTAELPNMKAIFDQVDQDNVKICWNSNPVDLNPPGLQENFNMVKQWIGDTVHVHTLDKGDYPYGELFALLKENDYNGWILLEEGAVPEDPLAAMKEQIAVYNKMVADL